MRIAAYITAATIAASMAGACISPHQSTVTDVDPQAWSAPAVLTLQNTDTTTLRDLKIFLRCDDRFDEDTISVRITLLTPRMQRFSEQFLLTIPHQKTTAALMREVVVPYRRQVRFPHRGDYQFTITPARSIRGVEAVGVNLVKSKQ